MSPTPSGLVSPDNPSGFLYDPEDHPHIYHPSAPATIPPVWGHVIAVLMKMPPTNAEGQNMRAWVTYHSLTSLEDFLMWELSVVESHDWLVAKW